MDYDRELEQLERLARWLDTSFAVPGTNIRFGLDSLAGLLPGVGDAATGLAALYIVLRAQRLGLPRMLILRMLGNVAVDAAIGAIPVFGDLFDVGFKANRRNVELLKRHFHYGQRMASPAGTPGGSPEPYPIRRTSNGRK